MYSGRLVVPVVLRHSGMSAPKARKSRGMAASPRASTSASAIDWGTAVSRPSRSRRRTNGIIRATIRASRNPRRLDTVCVVLGSGEPLQRRIDHRLILGITDRRASCRSRAWPDNGIESVYRRGKCGDANPEQSKRLPRKVRATRCDRRGDRRGARLRVAMRCRRASRRPCGGADHFGVARSRGGSGGSSSTRRRDARRRREDAPLDEAATVGCIDPERDPTPAAAIRSLPPRRRQIVFLRYFADPSLEEIATVCDVSAGTVAATLSQARAALRDALISGAELG